MTATKRKAPNRKAPNRKAPNRKMQLNVQFDSSSAYRPRRIAKLDGGGKMLAPFTATFTDDELEARLVVDVVDGAPSCVEYTLRRLDGGALEPYTSEIAKGLKIRELVSRAALVAAMQAAGHGVELADSSDAFEAVLSSVRRRRAPVTDERLKEFADAYRERWIPGRAAEFAASLYVGERQMYRLKSLAEDRGFLVAD